MVVYKIENTFNDKVYIGQTTKTPEQRLRRHLSEAKQEQKGRRVTTNELPL